jgi:chlorite dismutase
MESPLLVRFVAAGQGPWSITSNRGVAGEPLPAASALTVHEGRPPAPGPARASWTLTGVVSNDRYVHRDERAALLSRQEGLGRPASTRAVLIPIRKTSQWWALTQDERREIFEERSHHIRTGLDALPAVARRLHHCRDLGDPFDFLTWFEFSPSDTHLFDQVLADLRASEEWRYVDREIEIRLTRTPARHRPG